MINTSPKLVRVLPLLNNFVCTKLSTCRILPTNKYAAGLELRNPRIVGYHLFMRKAVFLLPAILIALVLASCDGSIPNNPGDESGSLVKTTLEEFVQRYDSDLLEDNGIHIIAYTRHMDSVKAEYIDLYEQLEEEMLGEFEQRRSELWQQYNNGLITQEEYERESFENEIAEDVAQMRFSLEVSNMRIWNDLYVTVCIDNSSKQDRYIRAMVFRYDDPYGQGGSLFSSDYILIPAGTEEIYQFRVDMEGYSMNYHTIGYDMK